MSTLIVGEKQFANYLQSALSGFTISSTTTQNLNEAETLINKRIYSYIVCKIPFDNNVSNEKLLEFFKQKSPNSQIIFIADEIKVWQAIELVKKGLYTCFQKPFLIEDLVAVIQQGNSTDSHKKPLEKMKSDSPSTYKYVKGVSSISVKMYEQITLVGPTNFNVIIYGETGTGKESVAQLLLKMHKSSAAFVAVDCSCLSRELAISELFGHEKGAFTGAMDTKIGAFEQANNGTLFLDEIGNLQYEVQTYLLRALQERKIHKLGGANEISVNVRIIVASNENLWEKVKNGKFREDLYHRLNEFEISVPPLRERKEDIPLLINYFIKQGSKDLNKTIIGVEKDTLEILYNYDWPGNIRELKNVIRKACLLTITKFITSKELPKEIVAYSKDGVATADEIKLKSIKIISKEVEMEQIMQVLKEVNYNQTKAAFLLNINRKTLYNKLKNYKK